MAAKVARRKAVMSAASATVAMRVSNMAFSIGEDAAGLPT
jgi:hypothetical protein